MKFSARNFGQLLAITVALTSLQAFDLTYAAIPVGSQGSKTVPITSTGTGTDIPQAPAEPTPVDPGSIHPATPGGNGGGVHLQAPSGSPNQTGNVNNGQNATVGNGGNGPDSASKPKGEKQQYMEIKMQDVQVSSYREGQQGTDQNNGSPILNPGEAQGLNPQPEPPGKGPASEKVPVIQFKQEVQSPRDAATGQATGKRQHMPFVVTKSTLPPDGSIPSPLKDCPDCGGEITGGTLNPQPASQGQEILRNSRPGNHKPGYTNMIPPAVSGYSIAPMGSGATLNTQPDPNPNVMQNQLAVPALNTSNRGKHLPQGTITTRQDAKLPSGAMVSGPSVGSVHAETKPTPTVKPLSNIQKTRDDISKTFVRNMGR